MPANLCPTVKRNPSLHEAIAGVFEMAGCVVLGFREEIAGIDNGCKNAQTNGVKITGSPSRSKTPDPPMLGTVSAEITLVRLHSLDSPPKDHLDRDETH